MPAFDFEYLPQDEQALSDLQAAPLPILIPILHINVICLARSTQNNSCLFTDTFNRTGAQNCDEVLTVGEAEAMNEVIPHPPKASSTSITNLQVRLPNLQGYPPKILLSEGLGWQCILSHIYQEAPEVQLLLVKS